MNARQKFTANELRDEIFAAHGYLCAACGNPLYQFGTPQLAHRIAKSKANIKRFGINVIHNALNLVPVCSLRCNDSVNIGFNPVASQEMADAINGKGA